MHIPDGFLSIEISVATYIITIIALSAAFRQSKKTLGDRHIPFISVLAAAIFGGQMLNFTLLGVGGTSGHLLGAALSAIIFGPYGALIILTLVLLIQALFFADGGILVLGANITNMGIIGGFTAYMTYMYLKKKTKNMKLSITVAAWLSVVMASIACTIEIGLSGTIDLKTAMIAMVPIHAIIGIGEALITLGIIEYIEKTRPDILKLEKIIPEVWKK